MAVDSKRGSSAGPSDLTREAADRLRELVVCRALSPGEQIRQVDLAERLGVSRSPLREALRLLQQEGLLVHEPHRGYFVARLSRDDLDQIYRMRSLLETELLASLEMPTEEGLDRLRSANEEIAAAVESRAVNTILTWNREFHFSLFAFSGQPLILREVERLWRLCEPFHATYLWHPSTRKRIVREHEAIIASLEAGDRRRLRQLVDAHRTAARTAVLDLIG